MCNNERVNDLFLDYNISYEKAKVIIYTKQIELLEYDEYLVQLAQIYTNSHMFDEALSLIKYIAYFDKCFIK